MNRIGKLQARLEYVYGADQFKLKRNIQSLHRSLKKPPFPKKLDQKISGLEKQIQASMDKRAWRVENVPDIQVNRELPIAAKADEIITAIGENPVVIISGDTGSGKTTQIPKLCLAAGRGIDGMVGCTQPRRIAATTVSARIAEEMGQELGRAVGYKIRFDEKLGKDPYIKIMTDGVLLAETQTDPYLNAYDTIIVDEAHERSLNIDFVLGILKTLLKKRPDLKLIVTSATIDTEKFSSAFNDAPVVEVSGRMYPVEVRYWPQEEFQEDTGEEEELTHVDMAVSAVERIEREGPFGDILVFMPTQQDIRETCELLAARDPRGANILPLFSRLGASEQRKVFLRARGRKIIVATNVAETSITIPGIRYVVDTGLARILRYLPRTRTTSLPVEPVSRSSADQRKGRCGRVENGICVRLFSQEDYEQRPLYTAPEILRSNLAEVILRMIALNLGDIDQFPFIDRPAGKSIADGFELLKELGAIRPLEKKGKGKARGKPRFVLTPIGKVMARIPVDPRISRMLIEAQEENCLVPVVVIAAALSIQDPRERPMEKAREADEKHKKFADPLSDFVGLLNLWNQYRKKWDETKSAGQLKRFCKDNFLSFKRMREWRDIYLQLTDILQEHGMSPGKSQNLLICQEKPNSKGFGSLYGKIHRCILSGFLSNIATKKEKNIFRAAKNREVMVFPGSSLFNQAGDWIVAAEMVETSRVFARTCAAIDNRWLEKLGADQCQYTYLEPHWDAERGEVVAREQVSLFGLIIVPGRKVSYGRIDPEKASEIFIQSALVEDRLGEDLPFLVENRKRIDQVLDMENRLRRKDLLVGEQYRYRFYESRLGLTIYDIRSLKKKIKQEGADGFLRMSRDDLINHEPREGELSGFPDNFKLGGSSFSLRYEFSPGRDNDGVTVSVPAGSVSSVADCPLDWHVPGLLREKILALIKALPKRYRKQLVPIADTADVIFEKMPILQGSLSSALSEFIFKRFGVDIPASAWSHEDLEDHLKLRFEVVDPSGKTIRAGRDRSVLTGENSGAKAPREIVQARKKWERFNIAEWDFSSLPESLTIQGEGSAQHVVYPGLEPNDDGAVNLRLFLNMNIALDSHRKGVKALYENHFSGELKFLKKNLALSAGDRKAAVCLGGNKTFEHHLYESVLRKLFLKNIRGREEFLEHGAWAKGKIQTEGLRQKSLAMEVLTAHEQARSTLYGLESDNGDNPQALRLCRIVREELSALVPENFMVLYDSDRQKHLPRYIQAMEIRLRRGMVNPEKDIVKEKTLAVFQEGLKKILEELSPDVSEEKREAVEAFFWQIEEFKVSLFAQELKTAIPVSEKRLEKTMAQIQRMV